MRRILFISWPKDGMGAELYAEARDNFNTPGAFEAKNSKRWDIVFPTDANALKNLDGVSQIYVMGHCHKGYEYLHPVQGPGLGRMHKLKYDEVCELMFGAGLQDTFGGVIKFYNCESGLDGPQQGEKAFAKRAGEYLADKGYKRCTVYGYLVCAVGYMPPPGGGGGYSRKGAVLGNQAVHGAGDWKVHCGGPPRTDRKRGINVTPAQTSGETYDEF